MIEALFAAGADVFRINMSHLPRERLSERVATIRSIEQKLKRPIAVLVDLQGRSSGSAASPPTRR